MEDVLIKVLIKVLTFFLATSPLWGGYTLAYLLYKYKENKHDQTKNQYCAKMPYKLISETMKILKWFLKRLLTYLTIVGICGLLFLIGCVAYINLFLK